MTTTEKPSADLAPEKNAAISSVTPDETVETGPVPATSPNGEAVKTGQITATVNVGLQAPPIFLSPNFERMPPDLKTLKNWLLWTPLKTGTKWTKRPIQTSGYGASTTNPKHWSSFDDVKLAYERAVQRGYMEPRVKGKPVQQAPVGGVGFVFDGRPDTDGLVFAGVDLDKVISEGKVAPLAEERIRRLSSYTEPSVSSSGFHVIVKARPLASGAAQGGVEMLRPARPSSLARLSCLVSCSASSPLDAGLSLTDATCRGQPHSC